MQKGICHVSQIPLRAEPKSSSEMVSQLLYGETYTILRQEDGWYHIQMDFDGYKGWLSNSSIFLYKKSNEQIQTRLYENRSNTISSGHVLTSIGSEIISDLQQPNLKVGELSTSLLGAPYLWGGRHFSGIDCSGFVQVVYKCLGVKLPRDASQQQRVGKPVSFDNLFEGDLVFFHKNERIGHVGIILDTGKIIHAHGKVRIDTLTKEGIINQDTGILTHNYYSAKRIR